MANKTVHSLIREDFRRRDQERLERALMAQEITSHFLDK